MYANMFKPVSYDAGVVKWNYCGNDITVFSDLHSLPLSSLLLAVLSSLPSCFSSSSIICLLCWFLNMYNQRKEQPHVSFTTILFSKMIWRYSMLILKCFIIRPPKSIWLSRLSLTFHLLIQFWGGIYSHGNMFSMMPWHQRVIFVGMSLFWITLHVLRASPTSHFLF